MDNKYICGYCNKEFSSNYILREHISYGHKNLIEFETSNINKKLLERINKLEHYINQQIQLNNDLINDKLDQQIQLNHYLIDRIKELENRINL